MASDGVSDYTAYGEGRKAGQRPDSRLAGVATRAALPKRRRRRTKHEEEEKKEEEYFMPQLRLKSGRKHETWSRA